MAGEIRININRREKNSVLGGGGGARTVAVLTCTEGALQPRTLSSSRRTQRSSCDATCAEGTVVVARHCR